MSRLGKQSMLFVAVVLATTVAEAAEGGKSVFSDAAVWIKGAYDGTGTAGVIDQGDLRHALNMSEMLAGAQAYGGAGSRVLAYEDVFCPYSGTVISNAPCLHLSQPVIDNKCNWASFRLADAGGPVSVTDCCSTVVMRIRPDVFTNPDKAYWVLGGIGLQLGFYEDPNYPGLLRMRSYCGNWQTTDFYAEPGTWMDIAVVRENESGFRFYAVTNGVIWSQWKAATGISSSGVKEVLNLGLNDGGNWGGNVAIDSTTNWRRLSFRGHIQSFAIWNRALSDSEIHEAFAYPRADIWRIGIANGSGGEFVKASPDGAKVHPDVWYTMPAALAPGEYVDVDFNLRDYEATLPQVLRLTSVAGSGGELSVVVNGTIMQENLPSVAGQTKTLFLPKSPFHSGKNTLRLSNASSGTVRFDAFALGGSWQVGYEDGSNEEFSQTGSRVGYVEQVESSEYFKNLFMHTLVTQTNSLQVTIPVELAATEHPAVFTVRAKVASRLENLPVPAVCELLVNGVGKGQVEFSDRDQTFKAKLLPGELRAGQNTLSFVNHLPAGTANGWMQMDFWRLEMRPLPKGFVLIYR